MQVKLARDWTDATGAQHAAGDLVEVDTVTLAELEATGVVASAEWAGPTGSGPSATQKGATTDWAGPTGDNDWAGPTGAGA